MKIQDGKIGTRELAAVIILTMSIKFTDTTTILLYHDGKNAAWMIPFVSMTINFISFLFMLSLVKSYKNKGIVEITYLLTGRYFGFITTFVLFFIILVGTILNSRSYVDILSPMFFTATPVKILYLILMVTSAFLAKRGFESIGRTAWIIVPYIKFVLFLLIIFVWKYVDWVNLYPVFGPGLDVLLKEGIKDNSIFGELIFFGVVYPLVREHKNFRRASFISAGVILVEMSLFTLLFVLVFSYPAVSKLAFPFQYLTRIAEAGSYFKQTESIFLGFWAMASIIHFAVYLYLSALLFGKLLQIHEPESLMYPLAFFILLVGLLPENLDQTIFISRRQYLNIISFIIPCVPIVLWTLHKIKRRGKHHENI